jgi:hypothetical protein
MQKATFGTVPGQGLLLVRNRLKSRLAYSAVEYLEGLRRRGWALAARPRSRWWPVVTL